MPQIFTPPLLKTYFRQGLAVLCSSPSTCCHVTRLCCCADNWT